MLSPKKSGKTDPCMTKKLLSGKTNLKKEKKFFREIKKKKCFFSKNSGPVPWKSFMTDELSTH